MKPRLQFFSVAPELMEQVRALNQAVEDCGLERSLLHLVKLRASQINGCSFCVDMHSKEAMQDGETQQRVFLVSAWKESPLFSERERAALAYTEAVTLIANAGVPDALYEETRKHFSDEELVKLSVAIGMINVWNRLCVPLRPHEVRRGQYCSLRSTRSTQPLGLSPSMNRPSRKRAASSKRPSPLRSGPSTARTWTSKSA